jgi:hypothetical protein
MTARRTTSLLDERVDLNFDSDRSTPLASPADVVLDDSSARVSVLVTDCLISPSSAASKLTTLTSSR